MPVIYKCDVRSGQGLLLGRLNLDGMRAGRHWAKGVQVGLAIVRGASSLSIVVCRAENLISWDSLSSVRRFAKDVERALGKDQIDGLILNADMQAGNLSARTEDGFEPTFVINHLAHSLFLRLLSRRLAPRGTVVITTSKLHDPRTNSMAPPVHANACDLAKGVVWLEPAMQDSRAVMRAYATSKLCNGLTAGAFVASSIAQERSLRVIALYGRGRRWAAGRSGAWSHSAAGQANICAPSGAPPDMAGNPRARARRHRDGAIGAGWQVHCRASAHRRFKCRPPSCAGGYCTPRFRHANSQCNSRGGGRDAPTLYMPETNAKAA